MNCLSPPKPTKYSVSVHLSDLEFCFLNFEMLSVVRHTDHLITALQVIKKKKVTTLNIYIDCKKYSSVRNTKMRNV